MADKHDEDAMPHNDSLFTRHLAATASFVCLLTLWGGSTVTATWAAKATGIIGSARDEYQRLQQEIAYYRANPVPERLASEALRRDSLILPADRDPLDVLVRRTSALLEHLTQTGARRELSSEQEALSELLIEIAATRVENDSDRREIFAKALVLRREIALKNPLLDFQDIVFLTHHKQGRGDRHMVDQCTRVGITWTEIVTSLTISGSVTQMVVTRAVITETTPIAESNDLGWN